MPRTSKHEQDERTTSHTKKAAYGVLIDTAIVTDPKSRPTKDASRIRHQAISFVEASPTHVVDVSAFGQRSIVVGRSAKDDLVLAVVGAVSEKLQAFSDEAVAAIDVAQVAERAGALIPTPHPYADLGPFYTTGSVRAWLGISRQALDQRVRNRRILGCPTVAGRERVYPTWQFQADGTLVPKLSDVLDALAAGIDDPWSWTAWLTARVPGRFSGKPAHQWLAEGREAAPVLAAARRTASRLKR